MKKRWIILLLLFLVTGAAGYGFTREEAQKVQKISSPKVQAIYLECESEEANPLLEDTIPDINEAVRKYFNETQVKAGYVEAYHNLHVYTKMAKESDTYVEFVTYDMKIRGIYTEVPGLMTFYIERNEGQIQLAEKPENHELQKYIARLTGHRDVQKLFQTVNNAYNQALQSDALLRETVNELKNAYDISENNS